MKFFDSDDNKIIANGLKRRYEDISKIPQKSIRDTSFLDKSKKNINVENAVQQVLVKYEIDMFDF